MSNEKDWVPTTRQLPPEGQVVWVMDSGGHTQKLVYENNLWWFPDRSMCVYFVPKFWKAE